MAITVTTPDNTGGAPSAPRFLHRFNVALDASYPAGGYLLGLQARIGAGKTIASVDCQGVVIASGFPDTRRYQYDRTADKLVGQKAADGTELAAATDLSLIRVEVAVESY
jgi:hypothetical protein